MNPEESILLARIDERQRALDEKFSSKLDAILEQTKKTNGRLTIAEEKIDSLESSRDKVDGGWKSIVVTAGAIAGALGLIIHFIK